MYFPNPSLVRRVCGAAELRARANVVGAMAPAVTSLGQVGTLRLPVASPIKASGNIKRKKSIWQHIKRHLYSKWPYICSRIYRNRSIERHANNIIDGAVEHVLTVPGTESSCSMLTVLAKCYCGERSRHSFSVIIVLQLFVVLIAT